MSKGLSHGGFNDEYREAVRWWFDPKNKAKRDELCKNEDLRISALFEQGYVVETNGVAYTQSDIDLGICPLNGSLIEAGLKKPFKE